MTNSKPQLARQVGLFGAVMMGLGSILGAGVFVTLGVAAGVTGPSLLTAIVIAAAVAMCNGLSSAQLAAAHPVSGGTYEYGYRWLSPRLGFIAGWMFLLAKSASAATAALGLAGYLLGLLKLNIAPAPVAFGAVLIVTAVVLTGLRRSNAANTVIVSITLLSLFLFTLFCFSGVDAERNLRPITPSTALGWRNLLEGAALVFVAYTGYGRVATLGEEVHDPRRTVPIAVIVTLAVSMTVYLLVAFVALGNVGAESYAAAAQETAAPLEAIAQENTQWLGVVVAVGAVTATLGVLLNLILGLSRVLFAMGRRGDAPGVFARISTGKSPWVSILAIGFFVALLTCVNDVATTWSFSAFSVLVYYSLTNVCALRMRPEERLFSVLPAWIGLAACASLALFVDWKVCLVATAMLAMGLVGREVLQALKRRTRQDETAD